MVAFSFLASLFFLAQQSLAEEDVVCSNQGLQWAFYNTTVNKFPQGSFFLKPATYKFKQPVYNSITPAVGGVYTPGNGDQSVSISIYGSPVEFSPNYFVLSHKGYMYAPVTGTYVFNMTNVDDYLALWVGHKSYRYWTRKNTDCTASYQYPALIPGSCVFSKSFTQGQYVPIRLVYAQDNYAAIADFTITAPDGTIILDSGAGYSNNIIQYGCGKKGLRKAPKFPKWGHE